MNINQVEIIQKEVQWTHYSDNWGFDRRISFWRFHWHS